VQKFCRIKSSLQSSVQVMLLHRNSNITPNVSQLYNKERSVLNEQNANSDLTKYHAETKANTLVLAELIAHITEAQRNITGGCVFKLADLNKLYECRLKQFGIADISVNTTRLKKDRLLAKIPELKAFNKGRNVLMAFEKRRWSCFSFSLYCK